MKKSSKEERKNCTYLFTKIVVAKRRRIRKDKRKIFELRWRIISSREITTDFNRAKRNRSWIFSESQFSRLIKIEFERFEKFERVRINRVSISNIFKISFFASSQRNGAMVDSKKFGRVLLERTWSAPDYLKTCFLFFFCLKVRTIVVCNKRERKRRKNLTTVEMKVENNLILNALLILYKIASQFSSR